MVFKLGLMLCALSLTVTTMACGLLMRNEEYLVMSEGFQGPVLIVFDCPDGIPLHTEGRTRRIEVPASGVLFVADNLPTATFLRFSLHQPNGSEHEVTMGDPSVEADQTVHVYDFRSHGSSYAARGLVSRPAYSFIVGRARERLHWKRELQLILDGPSGAALNREELPNSCLKPPARGTLTHGTNRQRSHAAA
jgi:hypothetical protein